ncbi:MAG: response regulator [Candidatus Alcyoniella australis]|nr:response regulator [Candidatus Alcyoniella australis]
MKKRVLIVDNDPAVRRIAAEFIKLYLSKTDVEHEVHTAADIGDALANLRFVARQDNGRIPYDLLILDVTLQGESGIDLYKQICDKYPELQGKVIFITGFARGRLEVLEMEDVDCLFKPFDFELFKAKLDKHLL